MLIRNSIVSTIDHSYTNPEDEGTAHSPCDPAREVFPSLDSPRLAVWQGIRCYVPSGTLPLVAQTPAPRGSSLFTQ